MLVSCAERSPAVNSPAYRNRIKQTAPRHPPTQTRQMSNENKIKISIPTFRKHVTCIPIRLKGQYHERNIGEI
jgi:hypothetical protein